MPNFGMKSDLKSVPVFSYMIGKSTWACENQHSPIHKHSIALPTWLGSCFEGYWRRQGIENEII